MRKLKNLFKALGLSIMPPIGMVILTMPVLAIVYGIGWLADHSAAFTLFLTVLILGGMLWGVLYLIWEFIKSIYTNYKTLENRDKRGGN